MLKQAGTVGVFVAFVLLSGCYHCGSSFRTAEVCTTAAEDSTMKQNDMKFLLDLTEQINRAAEDGRIEVVLQTLDDSPQLSFEYDADRQVSSASTIKTMIMAEIMRRVEAGELSLDQMIEVPESAKLQDSLIGVLAQKEYSLLDLMTLMIIVSDNTATNVLIDLTGFDKVNALAEAWDLPSTRLQRKMLDFEAAKAGRQNYTSAADQLKLFVEIANGTLLSPESCAVMKEVLGKQKYGSFRRYLPEEIFVAHKHGDLDKLEHDVGIFELPDGKRYVLGVFLSEYKSNLAAQEVIAQISKTVYDYISQR